MRMFFTHTSKYLISGILFLVSCFLFPSLVSAQTPPELYFDNQLIVIYEDEKTPADIQEELTLRENRAKTFTGRLQNARDDATREITGEAAPEDIQKTLDSLINTYRISEISVDARDEDVYVYTLQSEDDIAQAVEDFSNGADLPIEAVQPNYAYYIYATPNDSLYQNQWAHQHVQSEQAWDIAKGLKEVKVAVIDTGIQTNHPDLTNQTVKSQAIAQGCLEGQDAHGHGTHVAGVIGATTNNNTGIAGMNWNVSLYGYCVIGPTGIGSSLTIASGIQSAITDGVDIINLSLGGPALPGSDRAVEYAIDNAIANDIVVVAAAGNCGRLQPGTYPTTPSCYWGANADQYVPGALSTTLSVVATGPRDERASYSNYGSTVDIAAPGGNPSSGSSSCQVGGADCILSTWSTASACPSGGVSGNTYCSIAGTSMSAPHVAGLAALIRAVAPEATESEVRALITDSADDLGTAGKDPQFGYGRINAYKAIQSARSIGGPTTEPNTSITVEPVTGIPQCPGYSGGDFNCDRRIDLADFENWRVRFVAGKSGLSEFEAFRKAFTR